MTQEPNHSMNQIPVPIEDFPDPTDAQLEEIARLREAGADARTALATPSNGKRTPAERAVSESADSLALLALGGLSYGVEILRRRADRAAAVMERQRRAGTITAATTVPDDELAKYALLGLAFRAPGVIADGLSIVEDAVDTTAGIALAVANPVLKSRLFRPVRESFNGFAQRGESMVNELAQLGQQGQDLGKDLVEDATVEVMNNVVEYVAESDDVRDLIQNQTVSLFQEFLAFIQARLRRADMTVQRITFKLIPGDQANRKQEIPIDLPLAEQDLVLLLRTTQSRLQ